MDVKEVTFNDMPQIIGKIFQKIERVEQILNNIQEEIEEKKDSSLSAEHIPMTLDEACEFLRMKKSTMYYHLSKGNIPGTKKGKNYILYKDELLKWTELGRIDVDMRTAYEINEDFLKTIRRKPNRRK